MKYFLDETNKRWAFEDEDPQGVIDKIASDRGIVLTSMSESDYQDSLKLSQADAQIFKIRYIDLAFAEVETLPVTALGEEWNGGYIAGAKYKIAYDLAELAEQIEVGFKDTAGTKHTLSLADAKTVLLTIGADYIAKDTIRDDLIAQVNAATTQAELDAIVISFE